jgi:hypothetical protein
VEEEGLWGGGGEGEGVGRMSRASKKMSSEVGAEDEAAATEGSSASMGGRWWDGWSCVVVGRNGGEEVAVEKHGERRGGFVEREES